MNNQDLKTVAFLFGCISVIGMAALLLLILILPSRAQGKEPRSEPSVLVTTSVGYPIEIKTGTPLSPGISHGVALVIPMKQGWGYLAEAATTTGFTALRPSLLLITGPSKKLTPNFVLGASVFYKLAPPYDGASVPTHVLGGSIAPIFPNAIGSVSFPIGVGVNLATGDPTFALNFKLAIKVK